MPGERSGREASFMRSFAMGTSSLGPLRSDNNMATDETSQISLFCSKDLLFVYITVQAIGLLIYCF